MSANKGPLTGIRVLDLGRHMSCPTCGMTLGDLGAEVIKVEKVGWGDDTRHSGEIVDGVSIYFHAQNRNKKGITVDFRSEKGKELLRELIKKSDVLIENFRPGTMEKMGLSWEQVHELNPRLIMASISGYGAGSPYANRPGFDSMMSAASGIMDMNQSDDGMPRITGGIWFIDLMSGMWSTISILSALHRRETTGIGQHIDTAMYDACLYALNVNIPYYDKTGIINRTTTIKSVYDAPAGIFKSKDSYVVCLTGSDGLFQRLLSIIDDPVLHDPKYKNQEDRIVDENAEVLNAALARVIAEKTGDEWEELFASVGIPGMKVKNVGDVLASPASHTRYTTVDLDIPGLGPLTFSGTPLNFSDETLEFHRAPELGENNREVYGGLLGLSDEEIDELMAKKII